MTQFSYSQEYAELSKFYKMDNLVRKSEETESNLVTIAAGKYNLIDYYINSDNGYAGYAFQEDGLYYWIEVYDDEQGFEVQDARKSDSAEDFLTLFNPSDWEKSNGQLYDLVGNKKRYFPENMCDFTVMVYMLVMTKYADGEFVPNYTALSGYGEGYEWEFVFENNGISIKTHGVYTDRQGNSSVENSQWSLTDVGETEVVIPDEIKALKSQCVSVGE